MTKPKVSQPRRLVFKTKDTFEISALKSAATQAKIAFQT